MTNQPTEQAPVAHVLHPTMPDPHAVPGPGHRFGDPGYCGGCWWEQIGAFQPPTAGIRHADDCPGCQQAH